jgi:hypothetical protein
MSSAPSAEIAPVYATAYCLVIYLNFLPFSYEYINLFGSLDSLLKPLLLLNVNCVANEAVTA